MSRRRCVLFHAVLTPAIQAQYDQVVGVERVKLAARAVSGAMIGLVVIALVACGGGTVGGNKLDGFYRGVAGGPITLNIKDGKATVSVANESKTLDYKVTGNKLTVLDPQGGDLVFTINDDGTLNSEL